jgi:hypothetical protein
MTLARLLAVALLFCCLPAFTQDAQAAKDQIPSSGISSLNKNSSATPSEPWRIIANRSSGLNSDSMDRIRVDQYHFDRGDVDFRKTRTLVMGMEGPLDGDATCYTMRSYVVERDSKDSDSTHMTGYSTCQPASRFRVKTTVGGGPVSLER